MSQDARPADGLGLRLARDLAERILEEREVQLEDQSGPAAAGPASYPSAERLDLTGDLLDQAFEIAAVGGKVALAYSGGADSAVLLDFTAKAGHRPVVIWTDTGMEYPETRGFIERQVAGYGLELRIARPARAPLEQWRRTGWPMLGKMAARSWTKAHPDAGFRLNVSECCRDLKISPARRLTRNLGARVQLTGQRGHIDDAARGLRELKDGAIVYQQRDKLWIASPLVGWTDADVAGYSARHRLEEHPAKRRGAKTIGCVFCGGGSQFENSGYRVLRQTWPAAWRRFTAEWGGGAVILALKYQARLEDVLEAIGQLGGLEKLAEERPWVFDFTRRTPLKGYSKGGRG